jgi:hypothetical protein
VCFAASVYCIPQSQIKVSIIFHSSGPSGFPYCIFPKKISIILENAMWRVDCIDLNQITKCCQGHYPSSRLSNSRVALSVSISHITSPTSICKQHMVSMTIYVQIWILVSWNIPQQNPNLVSFLFPDFLHFVM